MTFEQNCEVLKALRLQGFLEHYRTAHADPAFLQLSVDEALAALLQAQQNLVEHRQYQRLLKAARLKYPHACPEDIDYIAERGLIASVMSGINGLSWVNRNQNLFFIGSTGTGKTYLACAQGHNCIRQGISVLQFRLSHLLEMAEIARADGSLARLRAKIAKAKVLMLDDWGVSPISAQSRQDLLEFVESKSTTGSVIVTSQLPVEAWHEWLGEPTIADAILDRLIHNAHIIQLKGDSMRKKYSSLKQGKML